MVRGWGGGGVAGGVRGAGLSRRGRGVAGGKKKTSPPRRTAPASAPGREDPGTLVERMIGSLWQAVAAGDPLRAELEAATCIALPRGGRLAPDDAQGLIYRVLGGEAIREGSAGGVAGRRLVR